MEHTPPLSVEAVLDAAWKKRAAIGHGGLGPSPKTMDGPIRESTAAIDSRAIFRDRNRNPAHGDTVNGTNISVLMGLRGVEPLTSRLSGVRSNQLSYRPLRAKLSSPKS
jgi:hypothetical protein